MFDAIEKPLNVVALFVSLLVMLASVFASQFPIPYYSAALPPTQQFCTRRLTDLGEPPAG